MLDALKFVQGAIGKKDIVTELTHFRIRDRRITSYNGRIALSSPIDLDIDCCPRAAEMVRAIRACEGTVQLHLTEKKRLSIRSGTFRTHVETIDEAFTGIEPGGMSVKPDGHLLPVLRSLFDIVSDDASKPWANGVLLNGSSAYATNNVILIEFWLGYHFPYRVNVPRYAIQEVLRINEEPTELLLTNSTVVFCFEGERWLKSQLLSHEWPDVNEMLETIPPTRSEVPATLFAALEKLAPFADEKTNAVIMSAHMQAIGTHTNPEEGTVIDVPGVAHNAMFNLGMLSKLSGLAGFIGFEEYPRPCPFYGDNIRGIIMGLRQ